MRTLMVLGLLLLLPGWATAGFFVCHSDTRAGCAATAGLDRVLPSVDAADVSDPNCFRVPSAAIEAQKNLLITIRDSHANGRCHAKVVAGIAEEMSQAEKDVVNAAIQAKLDEQQTYEDAAENNDLCNATLEQLAQAKTNLMNNLLGDIAGISNIATNQTELTDMMTRLVNALEKLMRCIRGRAGPP